MSNQTNAPAEPDQPMICQIRIAGHLSHQWTDWFGGLTITLADNGETLLTGLVVDQAALHGLLKKVRDLGAPLRSVVCLKPGQADMLEARPGAETDARQLRGDGGNL